MNKNQKQIKRFAQSARQKGSSTVTFRKPLPNYHSHSGNYDSFFTEATIELNPSPVNSRRNNTDAQGRKFSLTTHEPIDPTRPVIFKNHSYMSKEGKYEQPRGIRS